MLDNFLLVQSCLAWSVREVDLGVPLALVLQERFRQVGAIGLKETSWKIQGRWKTTRTKKTRKRRMR